MKRQAIIAAAALALAAGGARAADVEVLHWWTSGGEAAALNVLKQDLEAQGVGWVDMPVAGGGGEQAMTVLRARVASGNAPTAVQMLGFDIRDWAKEGALADMSALAAREGWAAVVPAALQAFATHDGQWVAAPVNVHSTNWVWANRAMLDELGVAAPADWDGFVAALDKVKAAGKTALAHGGQAWQDATLFEAVALATGGADFYKAALIDLDAAALGGPLMVETFQRMAVLRGYVDDNFSGRDWNLATAMVINGDAAFQIMGDWAKGEIVGAGKTPGDDVLCFRFPGTQGAVTFNADQFAMFTSAKAGGEAQEKLALAVMSPSFQAAFNKVKGSAPARTDVSDEGFDACGKKAIADVREAAAGGLLLGSMAHGYSAPAAVKNAMFDVITAHFNGEFDAETAAAEMIDAVAIAR